MIKELDKDAYNFAREQHEKGLGYVAIASKALTPEQKVKVLQALL